MTRFDLYGAVHKGLRSALFGATLRVARTDFEQPGEALATAAEIERLLAFLAEHAEHEDRELVPLLAQLCPEVAADLQADHSRTHGIEEELGRMAARLRGASAIERRSLGRRIHERLCGLVAEHLRHMEREEVQANRVLWANRTDDALVALHDRIVAAIAPARLNEWMELILASVSASERVALLAKAGAAS